MQCEWIKEDATQCEFMAVGEFVKLAEGRSVGALFCSQHVIEHVEADRMYGTRVINAYPSISMAR